MTAEPCNGPTARFSEALDACFSYFDFQIAGQEIDAYRKIPLLTGLSGGPDSTALALLAEQYARENDIAHQAVIVDHGLRNDSAIEASCVAERMRLFGINTVVKRIESTAPIRGVQSWARDHRYAILTLAARELGAALLLAHHEADQAETVFMRLSKGSGLAGLCGMAVARRFADILVLRPLLGWRPEELLAVCHDFSCIFESDPSNQDRRFERVRVRRSLATLSGRGQDLAGNFIRLSKAALIICREVDAVLEDRLDLPKLLAEGCATFSISAFDPLPDLLWRRVIGKTILAVGGGDYLPSQASFSRLRTRLKAGTPSTLGGCRFTLADDKEICWITHELGRIPPQAEIRASVPIVFANIWHLISPVDGHVRMLGNSASPSQWDAFPHFVRQSLPTIETLDGRVLHPHFLNKEGTTPFVGSATAMFLALEEACGPAKQSENGRSAALNTTTLTASVKDGIKRE